MTEAWRNAAVLGAIAAVLVPIAQRRGAWRYLPVLVLASLAAAWKLGALLPSWALSSLVADAPWMSAFALAAWSANADAAWIRARSWPQVVLLTALFGDRFVAIGLAATEPDPARRARLVLAASGASLLGITSGAAPLALGWGGWEAVGLALVLAAVGFAPGGGAFERAVPAPTAVLSAVVVPLCGAFIAWLLMLGGGIELIATALEQIPYVALPHAGMLVLGASTVGGALGDEGILGIVAHEIQLRALSLRGDDAVAAMRAGLAVGGGLPLLFLTRSRIATGLPLWLVQVGLVALWFWFR
jgi:hypothetical protein